MADLFYWQNNNYIFFRSFHVHLNTNIITECLFGDTIRQINDTFDLSCSCGYVTLINASSAKHCRSRSTDMLNDGVGDNTADKMMDIERSSSSPDNLLSFDGSNNRDDLVEISDDNLNIDNSDIINKSDSNGIDGGLISRGTSTTSNVAMDTQNLSDSWTPLELCYGIPLFDEDVNADVTRKVLFFSCIFFFFIRLHFTQNGSLLTFIYTGFVIITEHFFSV